MAQLTAEDAKTRNIEKMGEALGNQYSALWQEVASLYTKWGEYVELFGTGPSRVDLLNQAAPAFFRLVQDSLWDDVLLHLARLTDPPQSVGKSNLTICNLLHLATHPRTQKTLPALVHAAVEKARFSRDWRNRRIAHRDLQLSLDGSASPLALASRQHVKDALSTIVAVLNEIEIVYMDSQTFFEASRVTRAAHCRSYMCSMMGLRQRRSGRRG
jgi:hypothetical protein